MEREQKDVDAEIGQKTREAVHALQDCIALLAVNAPVEALIKQSTVVGTLLDQLCTLCGADLDEMKAIGVSNMHRFYEVGAAFGAPDLGDPGSDTDEP